MFISYDHRLTVCVPTVFSLGINNYIEVNKHLQKPFDNNFIDAMLGVARDVYDKTECARMGYVANDNITILAYSDSAVEISQESSIALLASVACNSFNPKMIMQCGPGTTFECRIIQMHREDALRYFPIACMETRNESRSLFAEAHLPKRERDGRSLEEMENILLNRGLDVNLLPSSKINGTCFWRTKTSWMTASPDPDSIADIVSERLDAQ